MGPVDEEKFEVSVDNHGIKDGPRLGRLRVVNEVIFYLYFSFCINLFHLGELEIKAIILYAETKTLLLLQFLFHGKLYSRI